MLPPREVRMAYRELGMVELREIIRRWIGGDGVRAIARGARVDRKTVVRYVTRRRRSAWSAACASSSACAGSPSTTT